MLGGEDHGAESRGASSLRPGAGVERSGVEDRWILPAVSPLTIGERIDAEVQEQSELVALPRELRGGGRWTAFLEPPRVERQRRQSGSAALKKSAARQLIAPYRFGDRRRDDDATAVRMNVEVVLRPPS
jgi:hypothetical protein